MARRSETSYLTWHDEKSKNLALGAVGRALAKARPIMRSAGTDLYFNIAPNNVSVRDEFARKDYEEFRPGERGPRTPKETIAACMQAYENFELVRNVIDLMSDFAAQGIELSHPVQSVQTTYREWFKKVEGPDRTERFLNSLFRSANVIVQRRFGDVPLRDGRNRLAPHSPAPEGRRARIPLQYTILNPLSVELLDEDLAPYIGKEGFVFGVRLPDSIVRKIKKSQKTALEKEAVAKLPPGLLKAVQAGETLIKLDPERVRAYYYKRDDWKPWALPMTSALLPQLRMLEKLQLADLAALDGAISSIRIWKLGSLEHKIMPSGEVILRLAEMLANNVGGGVMDLVWGPDIELLETSAASHQFLGSGKYEAVMSRIYAGLGVPPTMTGSATSSGFTNNSISIRTLVERLNYGRSVVQAFWEGEVRDVQHAIGAAHPAFVSFDRVLTEEAAERRLLIDFMDRDGASLESMQERLGFVPEIEEVRLRRESRKREGRRLPPKASPFHSPQVLEQLEKAFAATGAYPPSQFGVDLEDAKPGEQAPGAILAELKAQEGPPPGQPGQGRPQNSLDKTKRKKKVVKPRQALAFLRKVAAAEATAAHIADLVTGPYLASLGKANLRQLTDDEADALEDYKWRLLFQAGPGGQVTGDQLARPDAFPLNLPPQAPALLAALVQGRADQTGAAPPIELVRRFRAAVCAILHGAGGTPAP
jgi:hypothetical protein